MFKKCSVLAVFALLLIICGHVRAQELRVLTEHIPDASYPCGNKICGFHADIIHEIMNRVGLKIKIEMMPWKRAYHLLSTEPNIVLYATAYTKERADKFQWCGPLSVTKFVFLRLKKNPLTLSGLEDAKGLIIGTYADDVREELLSQAGFDPKTFTHFHGSDAGLQNLKMLLMGRIDVWVTAVSTGFLTFDQFRANCDENASYEPYVCPQIKNKTNEDILEVAYTIDQYYLYAAFSKETSPKIVRQWQAVLDQIKKDGTYQTIMGRYSSGKYFITFDKPF